MKYLIILIFCLSSCYSDETIHFEVQGKSDNYNVCYIDKKGEIWSKDVHNGSFYSFRPKGTDTCVFVITNYGEGLFWGKLRQGSNVLVQEATHNDEITINYIIP